jgi:excisionase family DNA binding protein
VSPHLYTTKIAAKRVGVTRATIQQWIKDGRVQAPGIQVRPGKSPVRLWKHANILFLRGLKKQMQAKKTGRPKKRV